MLKLKTNLPISEIEKPLYTIDYQSNILLLGSCFVEHIGKRLSDVQLRTLVNPFGTLFHPLAIEKVLQDVVHKKNYTENDLIFDQNLWHSPQHHSQFSSIHSEEVINIIDKTNADTFNFLKKTTHVIITLGTAWVYHHIPSDRLVANCHKIPQNHFIKRLLSVTEIEKSLQAVVLLLQKINPDVQILFTLSPVRHLKDGFQNNARSKAHLLTAIHQVIDQKNVLYFPSYELLNDDLRDYRFYHEDLIHPSVVAVDYIWELFKTVWLSKNALYIAEKIVQLQRDLQHKPFHPQSENYQNFLENIEKQKQELKNDFGIVM